MRVTNLVTDGSIKTTDAIYVDEVKLLDEKGITFIAGAPELGAAASGALTFTAGVIDGETLTIGDTDIEISTDGVAEEGFEAADVSGGTASQASAKMSITGFPSDEDTIIISDGETTDTFEIDVLGTGVEAGNIRVDLSTQYAKATATLEFTGVVSDGEIVEINGVNFEIDTDDSVTSGNVKVWVGANTDAASAIVALAAAIMSNEDCGVTAADGDENTLVVTAEDYGTAANAYTVFTTCANGSWGAEVTTLSGGDQPSAAEVVNAVVSAAGGATLAVTLTAGAEDDLGKLICTATAAGLLDGAEGNSVTVDTTGTSMEWDSETLSGGTDATYAQAIAAIAAIEIDGVTLTAGEGANAAKLLVEADEEGTAGNAIVTTADIANASWGAEHLTGGIDEVEYGIEYNNKAFFDGSDLYLARWDEDTEAIVWKKFAGSTYTG